jgi:hypothetical protein
MLRLEFLNITSATYRLERTAFIGAHDPGRRRCTEIAEKRMEGNP